MTDTEGPRTAAGKRLLAKTTSEYPKGTPRQHWLEIPPEEALDDILAIEAEARADVDRRVDEANAFGYREGHRKARADVDGLSPLEALNERLVARIDELEARADVDGLVALRPPLVDRIEEALHDIERPTKLRVLCTRCRPKAERLAALLAGDKAEAPLHEEERA